MERKSELEWNQSHPSLFDLWVMGAAAPMLRKEKRTRRDGIGLNESWRKENEMNEGREKRWRQWNQLIDGMNFTRCLSLPEWMKWRTNRRAASPFFSSTFVGPLRAIKKLSEKKWFRFQLMALFIHQKRKHFSFFDWIELRERKTNKFNQSFHSFMRMKIDEFCFSFFSFSLPLCGIKRIEMLLKEKEELIKGMKVNQWSGIELNQSHSAPFDWFLSFPRSVNQWNQTICLSGIDEARQGAMNKANHFFQSIHKFDELMKKWIDLWMKRVIGRRLPLVSL